MKIRFIALSLLCAAAFAQADGVAPQPAPAPETTATATAKPEMRVHKHMRPPHGDLRYCLSLKTNRAIIACSEKRRRP